MAQQVQLGIRIPNLSFLHHQLIAPLPEEKQKAWLQKAEDGKWSTAQLRRELKKATPTPDLPEGIFSLFYAEKAALGVETESDPYLVCLGAS